MGAGGGAVLPFFCRFALCDDMVGGGCDWVGCDFLCVPGLFKMLGKQKQIAGLITHYFGGNP